MAPGRQTNRQMRYYAAIDLKSFYASVECVERGLNPLTTNLVVADPSRSEKTICLAVSPSLKAYGIPGRPRLFEVIRRLFEVNRQRLYRSPHGLLSDKSIDADALKSHPELEVDYLVAPPRMALYLEYSSRIYSIYLRHIAPEDIHVYSIDEVFIDLTDYLASSRCTPRELVQRMLADVLHHTGITATAGIGSNLYLAKVAMDILAKHLPPDEHGARIAQLDTMDYRRLLWNHRPLTDFWRVGYGTASKLEAHNILTMGDIARQSLTDEGLLYRLFGINAELLIDHAWGWEPCTISLIKSYRPAERSLSSSQILPQPYDIARARVVLREMADAAALRLVSLRLTADHLTLTVSYHAASLSPNNIPLDYAAETKHRRRGRSATPSAHASVRLPRPTSSARLIANALLDIFDRTVNPHLLVRRISISVHLALPTTHNQLDLFADADTSPQQQKQADAPCERELRIQQATLAIKKKYGRNALLRGTDFEPGATTRQRNRQIGGHHE